MKDETTIKITNLDIYNAMLQHFKDDSVAFQKIDDKFEKQNELVKISGEHMSHTRLDLSDVKQEVSKLSILVTNHITAISPILTNYQEVEATKKTMKRWTSPIVGTMLTLASIIGAYYVIVGVFIK